MIQIRTKDGLRTVSGIQIRDTSGKLRNVVSVSIRDANGLHTLTFGPAVAINPNYVRGDGSSKAMIIVTTASAAVQVSGGQAPYTYAWTLDTAGWTARAPTSDNTTFSSPRLASGDDSNAMATCTVTDANGATGSGTCTVAASNTYIDNGTQ